MKSATYTRRIKKSREIVGVSTVTFGSKNEPTPCSEKLMPWLRFKPDDDGFVGFLPQDFRDDIRIKDQHRSLDLDFSNRLARGDREIETS